MGVLAAIWHLDEATIYHGAQWHRTIENTPALVNANCMHSAVPGGVNTAPTAGPKAYTSASGSSSWPSTTAGSTATPVSVEEYDRGKGKRRVGTSMACAV